MLISPEKFKRWRRYFCPVCGHVEWLAIDQELPQNYSCPLCGVNRNSMLAIDDPRLAKHSIEFEELSPGFWRTKKKPLFPADYNHFSYILAHPDGLILYDAPPLITSAAIEKVLKLGIPRLLVVSHQDFVGFASDWAELLNIPILMGDKEIPLPGNQIEPTEIIKEDRKLALDLEIIFAPGHSPGSLALYWDNQNGSKILCAGDILTVWHHKNSQIQLAIFQDPPVGKAIKELLLRPTSLLATCTGILKDPSERLKELTKEPIQDKCAKPWRGDKGGIWFEGN